MSATRTRAQKMQDLVESCPGFADALQLFVSTLEATFADDTEQHPELALALEALDSAHEALEALDNAVA